MEECPDCKVLLSELENARREVMAFEKLAEAEKYRAEASEAALKTEAERSRQTFMEMIKVSFEMNSRVFNLLERLVADHLGHGGKRS